MSVTQGLMVEAELRAATREGRATHVWPDPSAQDKCAEDIHKSPSKEPQPSLDYCAYLGSAEDADQKYPSCQRRRAREAGREDGWGRKEGRDGEGGDGRGGMDGQQTERRNNLASFG